MWCSRFPNLLAKNVVSNLFTMAMKLPHIFRVRFTVVVPHVDPCGVRRIRRRSRSPGRSFMTLMPVLQSGHSHSLFHFSLAINPLTPMMKLAPLTMIDTTSASSDRSAFERLLPSHNQGIQIYDNTKANKCLCLPHHIHILEEYLQRHQIVSSSCSTFVITGD